MNQSTFGVYAKIGHDALRGLTDSAYKLFEGSLLMKVEFDQQLAVGLNSFVETLRLNEKSLDDLRRDPTGTVKNYLIERGIPVPTPDMFHVHLIGPSNPLPDEPERATVDRFIYIFRKDGMFEFRTVPGSPTGNDDMMVHPTGACCCCNCCAIEI